jgi:hypothetical protein
MMRAVALALAGAMMAIRSTSALGTR